MSKETKEQIAERIIQEDFYDLSKCPHCGQLVANDFAEEVEADRPYTCYNTTYKCGTVIINGDGCEEDDRSTIVSVTISDTCYNKQ